MNQHGGRREGGTGSLSCRDCRHYYVTWDKDFPHGCRAMGFKSRTPPSLSVRQSSGMDCQLFVGKRAKEP